MRHDQKCRGNVLHSLLARQKHVSDYKIVVWTWFISSDPSLLLNTEYCLN